MKPLDRREQTFDPTPKSVAEVLLGLQEQLSICVADDLDQKLMQEVAQDLVNYARWQISNLVIEHESHLSIRILSNPNQIKKLERTVASSSEKPNPTIYFSIENMRTLITVH